MCWTENNVSAMQACCLLCLTDVASGMKYLHSLGLLHSDLKGANVLLKSAVPNPYDPRGLICKVGHARCVISSFCFVGAM